MKSKTSFFNKGLFFSNIKRYGWVSCVWAALMFLAVPMSMLTFNMDAVYQFDDYMEFFMSRFGGILSNLMLCGFPVLVGVLVFRYLHSPRSTTVLHGMPFSRPRLFTNGLLSGVALMLFPLLLNTAIILIIKMTMPVGQYLDYATIFIWLLNSFCMAFVVFSLTVFVGMFTGNIMAHFVFTYIIHFLPIGLWMLFNNLFVVLVYGYHYITPPDWLTKFPMMCFMRNTIDCDAAYVIAGVILLALALLAYRKRPLENASDIVVFPVIRPIFKYGVTFCMAITGYIYFCFVMGQAQSIVIALIFAVIGYAIAQMLLQKTWRIWRSYKGMFVSLAVIFAFWGAIEFDVTGYEARVPVVSDVESVTINGLDGIPAAEIELIQEADIAVLCDLHKKLADDRDNWDRKNQNKMENPTYLTLTYEMKNGSEMSRLYHYDRDLYQTETAAIYGLPEVRRQGFPIIEKTADDIDAVEVYVYGMSTPDAKSQDYRITDKTQINDILNVLKVDVNEITSEEIMESVLTGGVMNLRFEMRPEQSAPLPPEQSSYYMEQSSGIYSYDLTDAYTNTLRWLDTNVLAAEQQ